MNGIKTLLIVLLTVSAILTAIPAMAATLPSITAQPTNQTVVAGTSATFTVAVSGSPTIAYQWQISTNGGNTFTPISGATGSTYTISSTSSAENGNQFNYMATNSAGTVISNAATLTIVQTPTNDNVCAQIQCVRIQNGNLQVLSNYANGSYANVNYTPYFVKAVGYQPTPIGRYPSDWGYAPTDPRSSNNNIYDDPAILTRDFPLLQTMNANTIRIWKGDKTTVNGRFPNYITNAYTTINSTTGNNTLDLAASNGLKVIAGFWVNTLAFDSNTPPNIWSTDDNGNILTRQEIINNFVNYVNTYKGNTAILFWAIGNENNYQVLNATTVSITTFEAQIGSSNGDQIYSWLEEYNYMDYDGNLLVNVNSTAFQNALQAEFSSIGDNNPSDYNTILNDLTTASGTKLNPQQLAAWYSLVDAMAYAAHQVEGSAFFHPVAVVNGEIAEIGNSADGATDSQLPDLDIWGVNAYRGESFGASTNSLFNEYANQSKKPLWISEFGIDAWSVTNAAYINHWGSTLTADTEGVGTYDPNDQSTYDVALWNEIFNNSVWNKNPNNSAVTIGGSVMEYSDEWWKPYEFYCTSPNASQAENTITAGICNSNQKYFGSLFSAFPDDFMNQEWFGIVSISQNSFGNPDIVSTTSRSVYSNLETLWQANPWANITLNVTGSGNGTISSTSSSLGAGLNCNFSSPSSTGTCSAAFPLNQTSTLNFTSNNNSIITNWGVNGCVSLSPTCNITPDTNINLNVTVANVVSLSPYNQWKVLNFTPVQLANPSISGNNADPANDGIPNLYKYALNLNPFIVYPSEFQYYLLNNHFTIVYRQNKNATDLTYQIGAKDSLIGGSWDYNAFTSVVSNIDANTQLVMATDSVNSTTVPMRFFEFVVTLQGSQPMAQSLAVSPSNAYFSLTASAGMGGTISPSGVVNVKSGASQTFTITPKAGYGIASVIDNGLDVTGSLSGNIYTLNNVNIAHTIAVTFIPAPPTVPGDLKADPTLTTGNITKLSWSASKDNIGVEGYTVLRNGMTVASTKNINWRDTHLRLGTNSYQVLAYDRAGNRSALSKAVKVTRVDIRRAW